MRVLDSEGGCIACSSGVYVTNGYGADVTRFDVGGRDALQVRVRLLNSDGSDAGLSLETTEPQANGRVPAE